MNTNAATTRLVWHLIGLPDVDEDIHRGVAFGADPRYREHMYSNQTMHPCRLKNGTTIAKENAILTSLQ